MKKYLALVLMVFAIGTSSSLVAQSADRCGLPLILTCGEDVIDVRFFFNASQGVQNWTYYGYVIAPDQTIHRTPALVTQINDGSDPMNFSTTVSLGPPVVRGDYTVIIEAEDTPGNASGGNLGYAEVKINGVLATTLNNVNGDKVDNSKEERQISFEFYYDPANLPTGLQGKKGAKPRRR